LSRRLKLTVSLGVLIATVGVGLLLLRPGAREVTVYSSLPLRGAAGQQSQDMVKGIELALKEKDHKAGSFKVKYVPLDDSTDGAQGWAPEAVVENALKASEDGRTAVYIGEYDSGASAISIPILSRARVPQISPSNTAVGLTRAELGTNEGEPNKYYVGKPGNYVRIVPRDKLQGAALTTVMRDDGCKRSAIIYDSDLYGGDLAQIIRQRMIYRGMKRVLDEPYDAQQDGYDRALALRTEKQGADCVVFSGTARAAVGLFNQLARRLPTARLYGASGVAHHEITDGLSTAAAARVKLTFPAQGPKGVGDAGQRFYQHFRQEYSTNPDPYAIYAYEAMLLAIDAIKRAGTADREKIIEALHQTKHRPSAIGRYSIDSYGDTTLTSYGLFTIGRGGAPVFQHTIPME
jgi:branched-chain amino acid transport system substrate-binding protein